MRKCSWIWCLMLLLALTGCGAAQKELSAPLRVVLDRGHGSMWGNQFYMDVCADGILQTHFFSPDDPGGELMTVSECPITAEQWEQVVSAVKDLEPSLVPVRKNIWKRLFGQEKKLDGGEYHHLTIYWAEDEGIAYEWPANEQAAALETLLEQLVPTDEIK